MPDRNDNDLAARPAAAQDAGHDLAMPTAGAEMRQTTHDELNVPGRGSAPVRRVGAKRSAWAVWWLSGLTLGIYYLVWDYKINAELRAFAPDVVQVSPGKATWAQVLPIFAWVSLANTSTRLNDAHRVIGSPVRVSGGMSILGTLWFNSQTRYLQRRLNSLWDAQDTLNAPPYR